jgi:hypothetical protein
MIQLTISQYAAKQGLTRQAVLWQIKNNKLLKGVTAEKVGNVWIIKTKLNSAFINYTEC